ncbi:hypothetical protein N1851_015984 [Merluccius polli]|uniref:Ig-like domain-containing protein n=1 Tax=Merluccius polli TaxID=89951 RepID=A0AA47P1N2_MERPO|nr:hypothetical protein N1851_015984 [Merluccius polli]
MFTVADLYSADQDLSNDVFIVILRQTPLEVFNLEGQTLTLEPGKTVQQSIKIIRWKYNGNLVVNWNGPDRVTYYEKFKGRTTLDAETLKLEIKDLTLSDGGKFSLETEKGPVNSYEVKVISKYVYAGAWVSRTLRSPRQFSKISMMQKKHHFMCVVDTTHLGPVTYQWKMDNGDWFSGTERLDLSVAVDPQEVSCKVITRLSESEASSPTKNDCYKSAQLYEEDQTLTLRKCKTVQQPITIIRWKHNGNLVVVWNSPDRVTYFGKFKGRTTLDAETLKLEIKDLTLSDGGTFSLETEKGTVNSYEVKVISKYVYAGVSVRVCRLVPTGATENPPKPKAVFKPLVCSDERHCMCVVDPKDLGVVFYQWKMDNRDWFNGTERLDLSVDDNPQEVSCKVITRLSESEASSPTKYHCIKLGMSRWSVLKQSYGGCSVPV